ncbi:hypothetical protein [Actinomycetospora soli]|uniref:hypothetical protein n=1 Tax=Actinomycetospora soli TaxID=2893887 RepID=UPI001E36C8D1|nr:hypothetical protein [Actinomycetospora soli]MCD2187111.1 hypothetical protein [Actinomycetospora soli]
MSLSVGLPSRASAPARPRVAESDHRATRTLVLLVALALGALAVVAVVVPRVPALAQAVGLGPAPAAPVAPPVTVTAVVTATASCLSADPHDRVTLEVGGVRRTALLDGCGRNPGFPVPVQVPADGTITAPLAVAGTGASGSRTATDAAGEAVSPLVARLELALAVAAALGAGSLVVALSRQQRRPARRVAVPARGRACAASRRPGRGRARPARRAVPAQRDRHRR